MEIRILGAHNVESATTRMTSLLVDGILAVDAGALTGSLSLSEQAKVNSIVLTHCHYDHIKDVAAIGLNSSYFQKTTNIYSQASTLEAISNNLLNGIIYPRFTEALSDNKPSLKFHTIEPYEVENIDGYRVLALPVNHAVPTVAYEISSPDGQSFLFSGDTGPGLSKCWDHISPQLLIVDVTLPNRFEKQAIRTGHLAPRLLAEELQTFSNNKGYLPSVAFIHLSPMFEDEIREEAQKISQDLSIDVSLCYEDMVITI